LTAQKKEKQSQAKDDSYSDPNDMTTCEEMKDEWNEKRLLYIRRWRRTGLRISGGIDDKA
jgi:hypothetical protein